MEIVETSRERYSSERFLLFFSDLEALLENDRLTFVDSNLANPIGTNLLEDIYDVNKAIKLPSDMLQGGSEYIQSLTSILKKCRTATTSKVIAECGTLIEKLNEKLHYIRDAFRRRKKFLKRFSSESKESEKENLEILSIYIREVSRFNSLLRKNIIDVPKTGYEELKDFAYINGRRHDCSDTDIDLVLSAFIRSYQEPVNVLSFNYHHINYSLERLTNEVLRGRFPAPHYTIKVCQCIEEKDGLPRLIFYMPHQKPEIRKASDETCTHDPQLFLS